VRFTEPVVVPFPCEGRSDRPPDFGPGMYVDAFGRLSELVGEKTASSDFLLTARSVNVFLGGGMFSLRPGAALRFGEPNRVGDPVRAEIELLVKDGLIDLVAEGDSGDLTFAKIGVVLVGEGISERFTSDLWETGLVGVIGIRSCAGDIATAGDDWRARRSDRELRRFFLGVKLCSSAGFSPIELRVGALLWALFGRDVITSSDEKVPDNPGR
jgi:hypothetical protein